MSLTFGRDKPCRNCHGSGRRGGYDCVICLGTGVVQERRDPEHFATGGRRPLIEESRPVARETDPETSHEAAASIPSEKIRESQGRILQILRVTGAQTDAEIWSRLVQSGGERISPSGARTRRSELVAAGLVRDSGRTVRGETGRRMIVWEAVR